MVNLSSDFPMGFICATHAFSDPENHVPAPYLRRAFHLTSNPQKADLLICGLGFYDLFINGERITKGPLAPYFAAPDDILYYDAYDLSDLLNVGENVIGIVLGNGYQNALGASVWDFEKARGRGAPCAALRLRAFGENEDEFVLESESQFKTSASPITFDDLRYGVYYDARLEQPGWALPGFDDSGWSAALYAPVPRGEPRICQAEPIIVQEELAPVEIVPQGSGFRYDFGENNAGVCKLRINGARGQEIVLSHGEYVKDNVLQMDNIRFRQDPHRFMTQVDRYICAGGGTESFTPVFTYHGFRYVLVEGITKEQATPELLTFVVMHSDLKERGHFRCSDPVANQIQEITRRSDLSNFYYFPTDCPQREKNGWTADAALSAEHVLMNLDAGNSYREWMRNIRKAQREDGALPGIIPTTGWGFAWGNGPAWDCVVTHLPHYTYIYSGDTEILAENAAAIMRYLHYLEGRRDENGAVAIGLGDWCPVGRRSGDYVSPLIFTDTVMSMDIAQKAAFIFEVLNKPLQASFAKALADSFLQAIRGRMIDFSTMTALGDCQTSQAMALYYGVFEPGERDKAFAQLVAQIERANGHLDTGVLGGRVIFHVLTDFGRSDLAYAMITHPQYPSYADWVNRGATTLWEMFMPEGKPPASMNHHFWGDVSNWLIRALAGIRYNPNLKNHNEADIRPSFIDALNSAEGSFDSPKGRIFVRWQREGEKVSLHVEAPQGMRGHIFADAGWEFESGHRVRPLASGTYLFVKAR